MKVAVFSTKAYDRRFLEAANAEHGHELVFFAKKIFVKLLVAFLGFLNFI